MGNCLFLRALGWGTDHQERKKFQIPGGYARGGGMVTGQIEPCINRACDKFPTQAVNRTFQICNAIKIISPRKTLFILLS